MNLSYSSFLILFLLMTETLNPTAGVSTKVLFKGSTMIDDMVEAIKKAMNKLRQQSSIHEIVNFKLSKKEDFNARWVSY